MQAAVIPWYGKLYADYASTPNFRKIRKSLNNPGK